MPFVYKPTTMQVGDTPVIIYSECGGVDRFLRRTETGALTTHVGNLMFTHFSAKERGAYAIVFVRALEDDLVTDVWSFDVPDGWTAEPSASIRMFYGSQEVDMRPAAAERDELDLTMELLFTEDAHRKTTSSAREFVFGARPEFPDYLVSDEDFFVIDAGHAKREGFGRQINRAPGGPST